jgi:hypothetical protein
MASLWPNSFKRSNNVRDRSPSVSESIQLELDWMHRAGGNWFESPINKILLGLAQAIGNKVKASVSWETSSIIRISQFMFDKRALTEEAHVTPITFEFSSLSFCLY